MTLMALDTELAVFERLKAELAYRREKRLKQKKLDGRTR